MGNVESYYQLTSEPWGRIFYDLVWQQLAIDDEENLSILDFGSGFGITAEHYAANHHVTAIEPDSRMLEKRMTGDYKQLEGGLEKVKEIADNIFDVIIVHNVLEYCIDRDNVLKELVRVLKDKGLLSIVKHNKAGKVFQAAVFNADPEKAFLYKNSNKHSSKTFKEANIYHEDEIRRWMKEHKFSLEKKYGIRTFLSLIQDNDIKYDPQWYKKMLELENAVASKEPYKSVSFFQHYILAKDKERQI